MCGICTIDYLIHRVESHNSGTIKLKIVDIRTTIPNNLEVWRQLAKDKVEVRCTTILQQPTFHGIKSHYSETTKIKNQNQYIVLLIIIWSLKKIDHSKVELAHTMIMHTVWQTVQYYNVSCLKNKNKNCLFSVSYRSTKIYPIHKMLLVLWGKNCFCSL